jgi:hypothetical protein
MSSKLCQNLSTFIAQDLLFQRSRNGLEGSDLVIMQSTFHSIFLEELTKTTKLWGSRSPVRGYNPVPSEYEAEIQKPQSQHLVSEKRNCGEKLLE